MSHMIEFGFMTTALEHKYWYTIQIQSYLFQQILSYYQHRGPIPLKFVYEIHVTVLN